MSLFFLLLLLLLLQVITSKTAVAKVCPIRTCSPSGPDIRFPFRIKEVQGEHCGYEGFDVSCDGQNRTILHMSEAGDFVVDTIDYADQYILLKDPDDCLPKRLLEDPFRSFSSPIVALDYAYFMLANCSSANSSGIGPENGVARLDCLSRAPHWVVAVVTDYNLARSWVLQHQCNLSTISCPWWGQRPTNMSESMWLRWCRPDGTSCEAAGLKQSKWASEVTGIRNHGSSNAVEYVIDSLFVLPWFLCIVGFIWFLKVRICARRGDQISSNTVLGSAPPNHVNGEAVEAAPRNAAGAMGIDSPTIESYPKTRIDDLEQLPRPNDDVCAICLSKYERSEMIRTIPECEHYFHAYCIDQWLRKNASCPMCRNYN